MIGPSNFLQANFYHLSFIFRNTFLKIYDRSHDDISLQFHFQCLGFGFSQVIVGICSYKFQIWYVILFILCAVFVFRANCSPCSESMASPDEYICHCEVSFSCHLLLPEFYKLQCNLLVHPKLYHSKILR